MKGRFRLTTDSPENNVDTMNNIVFDRDKQCMVRNGGPNGEDVTLIAFTHGLCKNYNGPCFARDSLMPDDMDGFGEQMLECSMDGCPIGTMYYALAGAVECRARLKVYEESNVTPEEVAQMIHVGVVLTERAPLKTLGVAMIDEYMEKYKNDR